AAWLSSARVVRCLVKSYNERNNRFVLLRHAPKEKVFVAEVS
nr:ribosomal protein S10 [Tanacetum cinerariifolium]